MRLTMLNWQLFYLYGALVSVLEKNAVPCANNQTLVVKPNPNKPLIIKMLSLFSDPVKFAVLQGHNWIYFSVYTNPVLSLASHNAFCLTNFPYVDKILLHTSNWLFIRYLFKGSIIKNRTIEVHSKLGNSILSI